jgi:hypothetical protein
MQTLILSCLKLLANRFFAVERAKRARVDQERFRRESVLQMKRQKLLEKRTKVFAETYVFSSLVTGSPFKLLPDSCKDRSQLPTHLRQKDSKGI